MLSNSSESIWTLPDGIDDLLPDEAKTLELCRRLMLQHMNVWGYELVYPPILEYLDSLLRDIDPELNLSTMKMVDQATGRTVGIPADITPQIVRMESFMPGEGVRRLCYVGPILKAGLNRYPGSRNPIQIGAELFGHIGSESDVEIISLVCDLLKVLKIKGPVIELCDMGLFKHICQNAKINESLEQKLLTCLLKRDLSSLRHVLHNYGIASESGFQIEALLKLNGSKSVLTDAKQIFKEYPDSVIKDLDALIFVAESLSYLYPDVEIKFDLAALSGYKYHSSISFTVFVDDLGRPLCWGGRYEYESPKDGKKRPGTGFSADLKSLSRLSHLPKTDFETKTVIAPALLDTELKKYLDQLRSNGFRVIQPLPNEKSKHISQGIVEQNKAGDWSVKDRD